MSEAIPEFKCRECGRPIPESEMLGYSIYFGEAEHFFLCADCRRIPKSTEAAPSTKGDDEEP